MKKLYVLMALWAMPVLLSAQTTFEEILTIFDNNGCSSVYCHGGGTSPILTGSVDEVYANIFGVDPINEAAKDKGDKLIYPGYPERSFLYRKINNGLYPHSDLVAGEGSPMPADGGTMSNRDKEVIRQWIYYGANKVGTVIPNDVKDAIDEFHIEGNGLTLADVPEPPDPSEGFQIHIGPIFIQPQTEKEYLLKYDLNLEEGLEVNRMETFMDPASHHFILYKFNTVNEANSVPNGLRNASIFDLNSNFVAIWQEDENFVLPEGTAYKWNPGTVLDLNYHIFNYSNSSVLAAHCYVNVYTQDLGTAEKEMFSNLVVNPAIPIPANEEETFHDYVFTSASELGGIFPINIWMLSSHTHKYGKDFDIFLYNDDSRGAKLFEGHFNADYDQYIGYYDYAHPPIRYFDKFLRVNPQQEMIQEATFVNTGTEDVSFGLTTDDEMMIAIVQYTKGDNDQELAEFYDIPTVYCEGDDPVELLKNYEQGAIGRGVYGNIFDPALAGVGEHEIIFNCCDPDQMTSVILEVLPKIDVEVNMIVDNSTSPPILLLDNIPGGVGGYTIQWYFNGEPIEGANIELLEAEESGNYYVALIKDAHCSSESQEVSIEVGVGLNDVNGLTYQLSPNPFSESTILQYELNESTFVKMEIYDLTGRKVKSLIEQKQEVGHHHQRIQFEGNTGIYFLQMQIGKQIWTHKLIKQ